MKSIKTFLFLFTGLFILTLTGCAPGSGVALAETPEEADFAYGLNWSRVINDKRIEKYS